MAPNPVVPLIAARLVAELAALLAARPELAATPAAPGGGEFPLDFALRAGFLPEAQLVAAAPGFRAGAPPLEAAAWSNDLGALGWVFESGLDRGAAGEGALLAALGRAGAPEAGRRAAAAFLLDRGAAPGADAVFRACYYSPAALALFVERGLVPPALLAAPVGGGLPLAELVDRLGLPHPYAVGRLPSGENALFPPVWAGDAAALEAALAAAPAGALEAAFAPRVGTPLHFALARGGGAPARLLLAAGASAAHVTPAGESAVGAAARSGRLDAVRLALAAAPPGAAGAVHLLANGRRAAPLTAAALARAEAGVAAALVAAGADPTDASCLGVPAPFWAVYALEGADAAAAGYTPEAAAAAVREMASGPGPRVDPDAFCAAAGATLRGLAEAHGVAL